MRCSRPRPRRSGLTLIEVVIAMALLSLIVGAIGSGLASTSSGVHTGVSAAELRARAQRAVERMAGELLAAEQDSLFPRPTAPASSSSLEFRRLIDTQAGVPLWGAPCRFELDGEGRVLLLRDIGQADERTLVLTSWVPELAPGELPNGVDDNDSGLVDEAGLAFSFDGDVLTIRLTLQRPDGEGRLLTAGATTSVTVRN